MRRRLGELLCHPSLEKIAVRPSERVVAVFHFLARIGVDQINLQALRRRALRRVFLGDGGIGLTTMPPSGNCAASRFTPSSAMGRLAARLGRDLGEHKELAPRMRPARGLDAARFGWLHRVDARTGVGLKDAPVALQVASGCSPARRRRAALTDFIGNRVVHPQIFPRQRLAFPGRIVSRLEGGRFGPCLRWPTGNERRRLVDAGSNGLPLRRRYENLLTNEGGHHSLK